MRRFWGPMLALVWKDILLEIRSRDIIVSVLVFAVLVIVIFNFALNPTPQMIALVAPGILWVAFIFGGVLGLNRSFGLEKDSGNIHGLMLAPVGRDVIFFGKMLGNFLFMTVIEVAVYPVFAALFNLSVWTPSLIPLALLATLGVATVGTMFSAMAVNTRSREVLLPVLFFPVVLPTLIAAVEATGFILRGEAGSDLLQWLPLIAVFDAVFLIVCPIAFNIIIEE